MTKKDRIQVFQSLVIEFHQNTKVQWKSSKDYTFFGHKWVEEKDEIYNDPHLTNRLYNLLLSEIKHCQKISGESIPDTIDYNELVLIMKGGGIKGLAYVGALEVLSKHYKFTWYTGTSAGGIAAILLGCGFSI
ncbi:patatin-like phospholipase [Salegentibacter sp. 24]|uniref:patatin-like phospholipase family protein n=1 Tax=Salegentibacter sp. 24 TaxID=2183986 RepID=UPI0010F05190|nr:patatin-like phospholipase family protein [Salegentibacter sp. 24]TDN87312.1 patatin-like phospholipase [Salegentibacter sp. 24]